MDALALVDAPDHVCCRYRVRAFEPALRDAGWSLTIEALPKGLLDRLRRFRAASRYDAVILQRKLLPGWQLDRLRRHARRLIFDFDDAVFHRDSFDSRGVRSRRRAARFQRTIQVADVILAGNRFLADHAVAMKADPARTWVVPTCVDIARLRARTHSTSERLELIWIGSSSTLQGLERERALLSRIGERLPGTRLRMVCDRFSRFDPLEVVPVRWDEATEAEEIARGDVGISMIPDDVWSRGKCGLKLLQYRACGLPVVASPVGVHLDMVEQGVDGFLPGSSEAWIEALRVLADDAGLRARMGERARAATERDYSVGAWSGSFIAALSGRGAARSVTICRTTTDGAKHDAA